MHWSSVLQGCAGCGRGAHSIPGYVPAPGIEPVRQTGLCTASGFHQNQVKVRHPYDLYLNLRRPLSWFPQESRTSFSKQMWCLLIGDELQPCHVASEMLLMVFCKGPCPQASRKPISLNRLAFNSGSFSTYLTRKAPRHRPVCPPACTAPTETCSALDMIFIQSHENSPSSQTGTALYC